MCMVDRLSGGGGGLFWRLERPGGHRAPLRFSAVNFDSVVFCPSCVGFDRPTKWGHPHCRCMHILKHYRSLILNHYNKVDSYFKLANLSNLKTKLCQKLKFKDFMFILVNVLIYLPYCPISLGFITNICVCVCVWAQMYVFMHGRLYVNMLSYSKSTSEVHTFQGWYTSLTQWISSDNVKPNMTGNVFHWNLPR